EVVAIRIERLERRRREIECFSRLGGRPHVHLRAELVAAGRAVNHLDRDETRRVAAGSRGPRSSERRRWNHRVEERERKGRAHTANEGASWKRLVGQNTHSRISLRKTACRLVPTSLTSGHRPLAPG